MQLLRALPAGLSEWAVHPGIGEETPAAGDLGWAVRRSDHAFLLSPLARRVLDEEDIVVIDYQRMQQAWRTIHAPTPVETASPSR